MSSSLGTTHLLAYISDGESAAAVRALMHRQNIHDFAVEPGTAAEATEYLKSHPSPQTLIVEIQTADAASKMLDALADVVNPATRVIVTGKVDTFSFYHWLMGLGIHDYLLQPFNEQQLASALMKSSGGAAASAAAAEKAARPTKTIALIGARGGVGTTTVATALASILANEQEITTALIDLDTQFGSVALGLDLEPSRGLRDALEKPDRIDTLFLERVMMKPNPNLSILSAEEPFAEQVVPHAQAAELLFAALREKFPMLVVDLPRQMNSMTRYVLAHADHVIIISEPSILSLRDALRVKDYVSDTLKRPAPMIVINREGYSSKTEPSRGEFAKHLGVEPSAYVPFMAGIIAATGKGENTAADKKLSAATKPLRDLSAAFANKEETPEAPAGKKAKPGSKPKGRK